MHVTQVHNISVIHLYGEFDTQQMEKVITLIDTFRVGGRCRILLDMTSVEHIYYATVNGLVDRANMLRSDNGDLKIAGLSPDNCQILRFGGAGNMFSHFDTVAEGILSFYNAGPEGTPIYH